MLLALEQFPELAPAHGPALLAQVASDSAASMAAAAAAGRKKMVTAQVRGAGSRTDVEMHMCFPIF